MKKQRLILIIALLICLLFSTNVYASEVNSEQISDLTKRKITLSVDKKIVNNKQYTLKTHNKIVLKWNALDNIDKTIIYKYNNKTKKYEIIKTLKKQHTYTVSNLSSLTTYKFKIRVYQNNKYIESNLLTVKTRSKTNGYFYNKCIFSKEWDNVFITINKASNVEMNKYKVDGNKPFVKYNYSMNDNILYIHVYAKFTGAGVNKNFQTYKYFNRKYVLEKTYDKTYKQVAIEGMRDRFGINIKGNSYNFMAGCNFKTKVVLHTNIKDVDQRYTTIKIGTQEKDNEDYWFFGTISSSGRNYEIVIPTQYQLTLNKGFCEPVDNMSSYKTAVAHELGHNLGLADSYEFYSDESDNWVSRNIKNSETGYYENGEYKSLMYGSDGVCRATSNDIEMILQAQSESIYGGNILQYYKTHYGPDQYGEMSKNIKSKALRMK